MDPSEVREDLDESIRRGAFERLQAMGWTRLKPDPIGAPYLTTLAHPLSNGFAATIVLLPSGEVNDAGELMSVSVVAQLGLDYEPARRLTTALVGRAISGVVLREGAIVVTVSREDQVAGAVDRGVTFASDQLQQLDDLADIDSIADLLREGRAAPSSDPMFFLDHHMQIESDADAAQTPIDDAALMGSLLVAAGRNDEARVVLASALEPTDRAGSSPRVRVVRQLRRWADADGRLEAPSTPPQWPAQWPRPVVARAQVDGDESRADGLAKSRARREAMRAARAASAGKDRDELRALLAQELGARGLTEEPRALETSVDVLEAEREPSVGEGLKRLWELGTDVIKAIKMLRDDDGSKFRLPARLKPPERAGYPVHTLYRNRVAVELDNGALSSLEVIAREAFTLFDQAQVEVWFTREHAAAEGDAGIAVHIGTDLVGHLGTVASAQFQAIMDAAAERDEDPWAKAWLSKTSAKPPYLLEVALPDDTA